MDVVKISGESAKVAQSPESTNSQKESVIVKLLDYLIITCLGLIFFAIPLFFTGMAAQGLSFEKMLLFYFLVLIGAGLWVVKGVVIGDLKIKRTPLDIPLLALAVILVLSSIFSVSPKDSLIGFYGNLNKSLAAFFSYGLFYLLLVNNLNLKRFKIFFSALAASSALVVFYSILQIHGKFILPLDLTKVKYFNSIGSLTSLKMYTALALPLFLAGAGFTGEIFPKLNKSAAIAVKAFMILASGASFYLLLATNSSPYWPAVLVAVVVIMMFSLTKIIPMKKGNIVIPAAAFLLTVAFLVMNNFSIGKLELPAEVIYTRGVFWEISKQSLKSDPIFGSGLSTYDYSFSHYKPESLNLSPLWNTRFDIANGFIFELLSTVGVLGSLAIVVVVLTVLSLGFISLAKNREKEVSPLLLALFASFAVSVIFAFSQSVDNVFLLAMIIFSVFAAAAAVMLYPEEFKEVSLSFRSSPKYALASAAIFLSTGAGLVVLLMFGVKMYWADVQARNSQVSADLTERIRLMDSAINLFPYQDNYYLGQANNYLALINDKVNRNEQAGLENDFAAAIALGKKSVEIAPNRAAANEMLAAIYENASLVAGGSLEWAEDYYEKLSKIEPSNPLPHLRTALIYMSKSNSAQDEAEKPRLASEAVKKYDEAIRLKGDLHQAYYGRAVAYEQLKENEKAINDLSNAINYAAAAQANNIDYSFELGRLYYNQGIAQAGEGGAVSKNSDLEQAEGIFKRIIEASPNHANSMYSLALLYQKTGDSDNARKYVADLLAITEEDSVKEQVKLQFPGLY